MNKKIIHNKKGAIDLSFGSVFSTILIITFIVFGIYGITKFLDLQKTIQIESFFRDFQGDIDKMWKSAQGSQTKEYVLPTKIVAVCFKDDKYENLYFTSERIIPGKMINNVDISKTIGEGNSLCIPNVEGKVRVTLVKNFGDVLVTIKK